MVVIDKKCQFDGQPLVIKCFRTRNTYLSQGNIQTTEGYHYQYYTECSKCGCRYSLFELGMEEGTPEGGNDGS